MGMYNYCQLWLHLQTPEHSLAMPGLHPQPIKLESLGEVLGYGKY